MDELKPESGAPERSTRIEQSVVEGLPDGKTERITTMRRELADLQQHLILAQQRVAAELQGRVEDAERLEALETFVQAHEVSAQKEATRVGELEAESNALRSELQARSTTTEELRRELAARDARIEEAQRLLDARSSSLSEATAQLEARTSELATRTTEHARLGQELEDHRKQHRDVTDQLDLQFVSLRDANAKLESSTGQLAATTSERDALKTELDSARSQLAATTSERDALKTELEAARRDLETARTKLTDVASQLVHLGHDLGDGGAGASTKRTAPPPIPQAPSLPRAGTSPVVDTIVMTEEAKPGSRIGSAVFMLAGVIAGCVIFAVISKWSGGGTAADIQMAPSIPVAASVPAQQNPPPAPASPAEPVTAPLATGSASAPPEPAPSTTGDIVLPGAAAGHRVFVDGHVVEVKSSRVTVACGSHEVRIGSTGTPRTLDIACGGETKLPDEPRDK